MRINNIFRSIQGEGARIGTVNVFVRFAGCNLKCALSSHGFNCDTEFESFFEIDDQGLLERIEDVADGCQNLILTGGEPTLQLTEELLEKVRAKFFVAIETNGLLPLPGPVDWVSVSPKTAEHTLRCDRVDELRYVRNASQGIPRPRISSSHRFLSPAWGADGPLEGAVDNCLQLVRKNPSWALSLPLHKILGLE